MSQYTYRVKIRRNCTTGYYEALVQQHILMFYWETVRTYQETTLMGLMRNRRDWDERYFMPMELNLVK